MRGHERVFFDLVRNALWNSPVTLPADFKEWKPVLRLAKEQAMTALVAKAMMSRQDIVDSLPKNVVAKLRQEMIENLGVYSKSNCTLQVLVKALMETGVEPVLLKGLGLAQLYPSPEVRQCGDIDLYVGVEDYRKSYDVLKAFADEIEDQSVLAEDCKHFHCTLACIPVEVHKYAEVYPSLMLDSIYQRYASDGLSQGLVDVGFGDVKVHTPSDNFNAFYVFSHLWNHFLSGGVGLRQVCDWAVLLHSRAAVIDREYLRGVLSGMKLMVPWQTFGCIAVDVLGLKSDDFPFYDRKYKRKSEKVLRRIMNEGNFGQQTDFMRNPTKGYGYEKLFSLKCYVERFFGLVWLFPSQAVLQIRHWITNGFYRLVKDLAAKR